MLRNALLAGGVVGLVVGIGLLAVGLYAPGLQAVLASAGLTALVAFERWRYERSVTSPEGRWLPTGERFRDPTTHRLTEVYYNPDTGERDYRSTEDDVPRIEPKGR